MNRNQGIVSTIIFIYVILVVPFAAAEFDSPCAGITGERGERSTCPSGSVVGVTVVVQFSDVDTLQYPIDIVDIGAFLNEEGYSNHGNNGSVRDYFLDVSRGALEYSNYVHPVPYLAPHPRSYYQSAPIGEADSLAMGAIRWLFEEEEVGLTDFDSNGDGIIDAVNIFAQGSGYGFQTALHPHVGNLALEEFGGLYSSHYMIDNIEEAPELGIFCHENGHMLCGWGDYYPSAPGSQGRLGPYCLMSQYLDTKNPPHPNAYLKKLAGWLSPLVLDSAQTVQLTHDACDAVMVEHQYSSTKECFIIENRQQLGRDATLLDSGLAVFHVVSNTGLSPLSAEIDLVEADGNDTPWDSSNLWAGPNNANFDFPVPVWMHGGHAGFYLHNSSPSGVYMTSEFGFHEMVEVVITVEPEGMPCLWTLSGPNGFVYEGSGGYRASFPKLGVFTVEYEGNSFFPLPNPVSQAIDFSTVLADTVVFSTQFDLPFIVENQGDLGNASSATTVCGVDINQDGNEDLFVGNSDDDNLLLLGDGIGGFQENSAPSVLAHVQGLKQAEWADIDNDGDMDVFVVCENGSHLLLQNSASGFVDITQASGLSGLGEVASVSWSDVNRDGSLDCFVVHRDSGNELFFGSGTGSFAPGDPGNAGWVLSNANFSYWCDFDWRGKSSLLVGRDGGSVKFFENNDGLLEFRNDFQAEYPPSVMSWGGL